MIETKDATKIRLTITPDYVADWGFWEACRELLQNSIDQQATDARSKPIFSYDEQGQSLYIGATHCHLERNTLLLGQTTKRDDASQIGNFGEGYKLALLVLTRLQYEVIIENGNETWIASIEEDADFGTDVLTITIHHGQDNRDGVIFGLRDVTPDAYGSIHKNYLMNQPENRILDEAYLRGRIFVGGLFVCKIDPLKFGYNFSPHRVKLNRDRSMVSEWEVKYEAAKLWTESEDFDQVYELAEAGAPDVEQLEGHLQYGSRPTMSRAIAERYAKENGAAVPIAVESEREWFRGAVRIVPTPLRNLLHRVHGFAMCAETESPKAVLETFRTKWRHAIDGEMRRDLDQVIKQSEQWIS